MLTAFVSPAVVAIAIVCITLLILCFRFTRTATQEYQEAVDQLIEDHQVFQEGLNSSTHKSEALQKELSELKAKVNNIVVGKIRL